MHVKHIYEYIIARFNGTFRVCPQTTTLYYSLQAIICNIISFIQYCYLDQRFLNEIHIIYMYV